MIFSKNQIKRAGKIFKSFEKKTENETNEAFKILTHWRTIHGELIETLNIFLITQALKVDEQAIIAKRLKRSVSIIKKLRRLDNLQLSTMQDIAGLRVIVGNMAKVKKLVKALKSSNNNLILKTEDDYITFPKESGYRGVHLIFKYTNESSILNGLLIEIQVRTEIQHAWATSVETMGTYLNSNLKFNEGQKKWLKYFSLTSSAFSFIEKTPQVEKYKDLSESETYEKALYEFNYNKIKDNLRAFSQLSSIICKEKEMNGKFNLILLNIQKKKIEINVFEPSELTKANEEYSKLEKKYNDDNNYQVALVSTENILNLSKAYPNYFFDTKVFMNKMTQIKRKHNRIKQMPNTG